MTGIFPPAGVRFFPTDDVLINDYLVNKIHDNPLPVGGAVMEADVYGQHAGPWQLFQNPDASWQTRVDICGKLVTTESVRYVFTRLTKVGKGTGTKQMSRVAGGGCWHSNNAEDVADESGNKVGTKKIFKFKGGSNVNLPTGTVYIMHEYSTLWCDHFVLCKIKKIHRAKRSRVTDDTVDDPAKKSKSDHQLQTTTQNNVQELDEPDHGCSYVQQPEDHQYCLNSQSTTEEDDDCQDFFMDNLY